MAGTDQGEAVVGRRTRTPALTASVIIAVVATTWGYASASTGAPDATTDAGSAGGSAGASEPFTIGFTNPLGSNDQLALLQRAIEARAECLGGKVVSVDANLDVDKQISDI